MSELLQKSLQQWGLSLTDFQLEQFAQYLTLLQQKNQEINLTAVTDDTGIVQKHFLDSLSICLTDLFQRKGTLIDVGCGAGFPGIPIQIVCPAVSTTLLDSSQKRVEFLKDCCQALSLDTVNCIHGRAEDVAQDPEFRESFDIACSRAVAKLRVLVEYCLPFLKEGGFFIAYKGPDPQEEVEEAENAILELGGELQEILSAPLPFTDIHHTLVIIKKVRQTPAKYPRKAGKATKKPL